VDGRPPAGAHLNGGKPFAPEQVELVYWYADFPTEPAHFPYTASQCQHDWQAVTKLIAEAGTDRAFPMTEDQKKCSYCPYRSYCQRGVEAGLSEGVESALTDSGGDFDIDFEQVGEIEF
jgi:hypothetical protein